MYAFWNVLKTKYDQYCHFCLVLLQVPNFFVPVQIFWASPKIYIHFLPDKKRICIQKNWFLCRYKRFWRGTKCSQIFGLAQKIWTGTKHFGTCKSTRHLFIILMRFFLSMKLYKKCIFVPYVLKSTTIPRKVQCPHIEYMRHIRCIFAVTLESLVRLAFLYRARTVLAAKYFKVLNQCLALDWNMYDVKFSLNI